MSVLELARKAYAKVKAQRNGVPEAHFVPVVADEINEKEREKGRGTIQGFVANMFVFKYLAPFERRRR